jgi:Uma2 family endonuclease
MAANLKDLPRHYYTLEEYFALERVGEARYEYWDGDIVCMSGGSRQHVTISGNVYYSIRRQLEGRNCQVFTGDLQIRTPQLPPYRYPDVSVVCGRPGFAKVEGFDVLTNPILIVEVLSPGTASRDRNEKREAYQALPSLMEYLLVAQDMPHITHYLRQEDEWIRRDYGDPAATINLPSIKCLLALSDVYDRVKFK